MPLTSEQEGAIRAWGSVFPDGTATTSVFRQMAKYALAQVTEGERAGAAGIVLFMLLKRTEAGAPIPQKGKDKRG